MALDHVRLLREGIGIGDDSNARGFQLGRELARQTGEDSGIVPELCEPQT
jgi:hypothetical protein